MNGNTGERRDPRHRSRRRRTPALAATVLLMAACDGRSGPEPARLRNSNTEDADITSHSAGDVV